MRGAGAESPTRLRLFLDDTILSPTLAPRLAFSAALDHREPRARSVGHGRRRLWQAHGGARRPRAVAGRRASRHRGRARPRSARRPIALRLHASAAARRHALTRTFVTRDRRGRAVPNVPLVAGAAGGAMIARPGIRAVTVRAAMRRSWRR